MKRVHLIGGAIAALVFLGCSFAVYTVVGANNQAKTALKKIEAATKVGVNYAEYKRLLIDAQLAVEEARTPRYSIVLSRYKLAGNWWKVGTDNAGQICAGHYEPGALKSQVESLVGPGAKADGLSIGCRETQAYLNLAWEQASKELAQL